MSLMNNNYDELCSKYVLNESDLEDKVLGMGYSFEEDIINVQVGNKAEREIKTKKDLLSFVASVYDPLGLVAITGLISARMKARETKASEW